MSRYFLTVNASRPYIAGALTFTFEPVQNRGGSWLGILSVADEAAASTLSAAALYGVEEITSERFDSLKKKQMGIPDALNGSPKPQRVRTPGAGAEGVSLVERSGRTPGVGNPLIESRPKPAPVVESVSLQTSSTPPPVEPLLESPSDKPAKRYTAKMPR
jgi:hypothetical protein